MYMTYRDMNTSLLHNRVNASKNIYYVLSPQALLVDPLWLRQERAAACVKQASSELNTAPLVVAAVYTIEFRYHAFSAGGFMVEPR